MIAVEDQQLAELQAKYPGWDVWKVPTYIGPTAWCVKPKGARIAVHREDSADALDKWLAAQPSSQV